MCHSWVFEGSDTVIVYVVEGEEVEEVVVSSGLGRAGASAYLTRLASGAAGEEQGLGVKKMVRARRQLCYEQSVATLLEGEERVGVSAVPVDYIVAVLIALAVPLRRRLEGQPESRIM